ncbi:hypothetical protein [Nocardioides panzhihuensis]|uniref:Uncharacterized protein n=1 Tax=Nocardioides panzhihuensis TaxID=860243 RepID=A0A7Z0DQT0_9ACTN|nr:hypothetical protein [Nocardioides panzhihuensis]NYI80095.1 hypothetical protein [Nocardioides panzhihuensis]
MWELLSTGVDDSDDLAMFRNMLRLFSQRQLKDFRGHLDRTLEAVSVVDLVDGEGCSYVGDAKLAAAMMLLAGGRDRTAEAIAAGVVTVPEPVERGLELMEVLEAEAEEPEGDWADGKLIFSVVADVADWGVPNIARGFERAEEIVESDKALQAVVDSGEVKSVYVEIFPWHMDGTVEPPKFSRRNGRCKVSAVFDLDALPEDRSDVGIELVVDLVRQAGVRFKLPVADLVSSLELAASAARNR